MSEEQLAIQLEGLLFATGKPFSKSELATLTQTDESQVALALAYLKSQKARGLVIVDDGSTVELRTSPEVSTLVDSIRRRDNSADITRAGLEVLAAILYRGPLTRSEIDFIRGVNSTQMIRTLTMRGLVRKVQNPKDERSFLYEATTELLAAMGATHPRDLPNFDAIKQKLLQLEDAYRVQQQTQP